MESTAVSDLIALLIGYSFGSIPFGLILTRLAGLGDVRAIGSGNIGATNVLRTGNKTLAAATLLCDLLKGAAAVWLARHLFGEIAGLIAGLAAFFGHLFPVWIGFKGGKGVATFIGVVLAIDWHAALAFCVIWTATATIFRYSSLSALIASLAPPAVMFYFMKWDAALAFTAMTALIWFRHRANLGRLLSGTEPKIGASK